jgi:hypothetical protein
MKNLLIAAILTMMATNAFAEISGNEYMNYSYSEQVSYIAGITDALIFMNVICGTDQHQTYGQLKNVVDKFLRNNPEQTHFSMSFLYGTSIMSAFNCRQTDKKQKTEVKW